jgi:acid phosphatase
MPVFALLAASLAFPARAANVPAADHVVVVVMENRSVGQVRYQPYTAGLMAAGAWFASSYGIGYPSQPNYFALWSGSTQGVTSDACPAPGAPFGSANLGQACEATGKTWRSYAENLATAGATDCSFDGDASTGLYTRKHAPWTYFSNVDHSNERPYTDLAADLAAGQLPNLAFVLPNNCHNTHDLYVDPSCDVPQGDAWLAANMPPILAALGPNDVLILTWDEDDRNAGNSILTVFVGPLVLPHSVSVRYITHYTVARTIADLLGVPPPGQSATEFPIVDVWDFSTPVPPASWGRLKALYR